MPLVVPGMQSKEGGSGGNEKTADWMNKLMGKKIGEGNDETVCFSFFFLFFFFHLSHSSKKPKENSRIQLSAALWGDSIFFASLYLLSA